MGYTPPKNAEGKRVPSVTGIIGNRKQLGGLMHWAWQMGADGKDYRDERDKACSAGHYAHSYAEHTIKGIPFEEDMPGLTEEAKALGLAGIQAFKDWRKQSKFELQHSEITMCHEALQYGGTIDCIGRVNGELAVLDFKCANGTYLEHVIQLAAYIELFNSNNPENTIKQAHLLRMGKDFGDFHHHSWPPAVMDDCWDMFTHMHALYLKDKRLKNVAS